MLTTSGWLVQPLHEPEARAADTRLGLQLELVRDRADDRDPETAFGELLALERRRLVRVEAPPIVDHLDGECVAGELVADRDEPRSPGIRMPDRVRHGLGQRELEIGQRLLGQRADVGATRERETSQSDVLSPRRYAKPDDPHPFDGRAVRLDQCRLAHLTPRWFP